MYKLSERFSNNTTTSSANEENNNITTPSITPQVLHPQVLQKQHKRYTILIYQ